MPVVTTELLLPTAAQAAEAPKAEENTRLHHTTFRIGDVRARVHRDMGTRALASLSMYTYWRQKWGEGEGGAYQLPMGEGHNDIVGMCRFSCGAGRAAGTPSCVAERGRPEAASRLMLEGTVPW